MLRSSAHFPRRSRANTADVTGVVLDQGSRDDSLARSGASVSSEPGNLSSSATRVDFLVARRFLRVFSYYSSI